MKLSKIYEIMKYHIVDTTAALAVTNPIFAAFETGIAEMPDELSLNARLLTSAIFYLGLGSLISRGRDIYKKLFKIPDKLSEKAQWLYDTPYFMAVSLLIGPVLYQASGANLKQTMFGTWSGVGLSLVNGYIIGGSYDIGRDLTGLKESKRLPEKIRKLPKKVKGGIAISLLVALVAINFGIYKITPDKPNINSKETKSIETVIEQKQESSIDVLVN